MGRLNKTKLRAEDKSTSILNFNFIDDLSLEKLKETNHKIMMWLKRIGWVGFAFFLLKGFAWIAVWLGLAKYFNG
ncbi:MAG: hypothetical protein ACI85Q_001872 [Salibacteraceae bacterium]|jgi:hypothetical protein